MSLSVESARRLVDGLAQAGVTWLVLAPGSRSSPLVFAAYEASRAGRLRLVVRADERVAGFTALGLSLADDGVAAVACTSGTAAANLHPAVMEAHYSRIPLVVVTADRPAELQGVGANQTGEQRGLYGRAPVWQVNLEAPDADPALAVWAKTGQAAVAAARGRLGGQAGPVHINARFREPLVPAGQPGPAAPAVRPGRAGHPSGAPATAPEAAAGQAAEGFTSANQFHPLPLERGPRTVIVAGAGAGPAAGTLAAKSGWPLLAEPESGCWMGSVPAGRLLVESRELGQRIQRVVVYGRPVLSRPITRLVQRPGVEVIVVHQGGGAWFDLGRTASRIASRVFPLGDTTWDERDWRASWSAAGQTAWEAQVAARAAGAPSGVMVAHAVAKACGNDRRPLVVGASNAIRYLDLTPAQPCEVVALRGLAGIDGTVSAATGLALGRGGPVRVLLGDLTLAHDAGALGLPRLEARPSVQIILLNDQGGGIFRTLEVGDPAYHEVFERFFATPVPIDWAALASAYGAGYRLAGDLPALEAALARPGAGIELVEVPLGGA